MGPPERIIVAIDTISQNRLKYVLLKIVKFVVIFKKSVLRFTPEGLLPETKSTHDLKALLWLKSCSMFSAESVQNPEG